MNQIDQIQDKIKGEIKSAEESEAQFSEDFYPSYKEYHKGKIRALQDLQQWIKDNIEEG